MTKTVNTKLKIKFIMLMAKSLHRYGASADRIEAALFSISDKLKINASYFSLPTSIMASFKIDDDEYTSMERLEPGKINLEKLYYSDMTVDDVIDEKISLTEGISRLEFIIDKNPLHSDFSTVLSLMILASNVALILGGNLWDAFICSILGFIVGHFSAQVKIERFDTISEAIIAFFISLSSLLISTTSIGVHPNIIILSTLIYYVPGLSLTMGIGEISSQNLTAGTARLMGALVILLKLAFGTYLGSIVAGYIHTAEVTPTLFVLAPAFKIIAIIFICFSFVISFQARWEETPWIILAGLSTYGLNAIVAAYMGKTAAALISGAYIGAGANLYARLLKRPSMIVSLPAIILLVPGSVGFKGIEFLFSQNTLNGINTLFNTLILGLALVAGTYFGNLIIRPKRSL